MKEEEKYDPSMYFTALAKGDAKALQCIYDTYRDALAVFLRRYVTDDRWTINIIVLEVLMVLWEKREYIPEIKEPVKWMFGIAEKKALQHLQNNRLHIFIPLEELYFINRNDYADDSIIEQELAIRLRDAISRLPPQQRHIWLLKNEQQLSNEQIADRLQISNQTVRNEYSRAKKKLLKLLGYMVIGLILEILKFY